MTEPTTTQKSAFVTGASKGIGLAVAHALAAQGYAVTLTSRKADEVEAAAAAVGSGARGVVCDVKDHAALVQEVDAHVAAFGGLDVLFVNAGVGHFGNPVWRARIPSQAAEPTTPASSV
jgi:3-oxoacyl-[acyl-carrier protein] reductase